jgi:Flp pilus assembly protein TadD
MRNPLLFSRARQDALAVIDDLRARMDLPEAICQRARARVFRDSALRRLSVGQRRLALQSLKKAIQLAPHDPEMWGLAALALLPGPWPDAARWMRRRWKQLQQENVSS